MIKEVIIVEGKDDITRVKEALSCEVISTNGIHISRKRLKEIIDITKDRGAIILTDPDHAGEKIRKKLQRHLKCEIKEAYIKRDLCKKNSDIGIENASIKEIRDAIDRARPVVIDNVELYDSRFMFRYGLTGRVDSKIKRDFLSDALNLGRPNAKEFLRRINAFSIDRDTLEKLIREYEDGKNISSKDN